MISIRKFIVGCLAGMFSVAVYAASPPQSVKYFYITINNPDISLDSCYATVVKGDSFKPALPPMQGFTGSYSTKLSIADHSNDKPIPQDATDWMICAVDGENDVNIVFSVNYLTYKPSCLIRNSNAYSCTIKIVGGNIYTFTVSKTEK